MCSDGCLDVIKAIGKGCFVERNVLDLKKPAQVITGCVGIGGFEVGMDWPIELDEVV